MAKRKQKRVRKNEDPLVLEKLERLNRLRDSFKAYAAEYEEYLNILCQQKCDRISKIYMDKMNTIPKEFLSMKMSEVVEKMEKERQRQTECPKEETAIRSMLERQKMTTEKKRTLKKERKRSLSATASTKPLVLGRPPTNTFSRLSKAMSESSLATPSRANRLPSTAITPKFNPTLPVSQMARRPKPGELLMSLSGSPLQNMTNDAKLSVPLMNGIELVVKDTAGLEKNFLKELELSVKEAIKSVKEKCDRIIQS